VPRNAYHLQDAHRGVRRDATSLGIDVSNMTLAEGDSEGVWRGSAHVNIGIGVAVVSYRCGKNNGVGVGDGRRWAATAAWAISA